MKPDWYHLCFTAIFTLLTCIYLPLFYIAPTPMPKDCQDVREQGGGRDGIFTIFPTYSDSNESVKVWCDQQIDGGGWLVNSCHRYWVNVWWQLILQKRFGNMYYTLKYIMHTNYNHVIQNVAYIIYIIHYTTWVLWKRRNSFKLLQPWLNCSGIMQLKMLKVSVAESGI